MCVHTWTPVDPVSDRFTSELKKNHEGYKASRRSPGAWCKGFMCVSATSPARANTGKTKRLNKKQAHGNTMIDQDTWLLTVGKPKRTGGRARKET